MKWTEEEMKYLKENYPNNYNMQEMCKGLNRSRKAIQHKATRIDIHRPRFPCDKPRNRKPRKVIDKEYYERNKEEIYKRKQDRIFKCKKEFKKLLGGKCSICNYNKCLAALEFHHNSGEKEGHVSWIIKNFSRKKGLKEIKKCILLCANCHRELHNTG